MPVPVEEQILILFAGVNGYLDEVPNEKIKSFEKDLINYIKANNKEILQEIVDKKELSEQLKDEIGKNIKEFLSIFLTNN